MWVWSKKKIKDMAEVQFANPVDNLHGKINTPKSKDGAICVFRQKCYGVTSRGKKILGPKESYVMYKHQGKWSAGAEENRRRFAAILTQAHAELRDPERKAYWQGLFEEQFEHPEIGKKRYVMLSAFVAAKLKEQEAG